MNVAIPLSVRRINTVEFELREDTAPYAAWIERRQTEEATPKVSELTLKQSIEPALTAIFQKLGRNSATAFLSSIKRLHIINVSTIGFPDVDLSKFPKLRSLHVTGVNSTTVMNLSRAINLTDLCLHHGHVINTREWLKHLPRLQTLGLRIAGNAKQNSLVLKGLKSCVSTLKRLELSFFSMFPSRVLGEISTCISLTKLHLRFEHDRKVETCTVDEFSHLSKLKNLEDLLFDRVAIGRVHLNRVQTLTSLKQLRILGSTNLLDDGVEMICRYFTQLEILALSGSQCTAACAVHLAQLGRLKTLIISKTALTTNYESILISFRQYGTIPRVQTYNEDLNQGPQGVYCVEFREAPTYQKNKIFEERRKLRLKINARRTGVKLCANCGKAESDKSIPRCGWCKTVHYCNRACQAQDWPQHSKICSRPV